MLLNYIKLSIRLLARNPFMTFVKVIGLAIGLAIFLVLWQYVQSELKSDKQWPDHERIYRFGTIIKWTDDKTNWEQSYMGTILAAQADLIRPQYPEIQEVTRLLSQPCIAKTGSSYVEDHGPELFLSAQTGALKKSFKETQVAYADRNFFTFFGMPLIEGRPESALDLAGSIVLSEKLAFKYFGTTDVIGKTILINDQISLTVTGVFENLPHNTHLVFEAVVSSEGIKHRYPIVTGDVRAPVHYFKLHQGVDPTVLSKKINKDTHAQMLATYWGNSGRGDIGTYLQPLSEMPFQSYIMDNYTTKSSFVLKTYKSVAIAILLLAWINYINLTSASNLARMKEVVTRRIVGARIIELVFQFTVEAFVINAIALSLALTIVQLIKVPMELLLGFYILPWTSLIQSSFWILLAVFISGVLFTGLYLAWTVVRHSPQRIVGLVSMKSGIPTSLFTTLQYTVAISIVIFAFTIKAQLNYIFDHDIGFNKDQVIVVDLPLTESGNLPVDLKTFLGKVRDLNPTVSQTVAGDEGFGFINMTEPEHGANVGVLCNGGVDENYLPLYNIRLLKGRNFLPDDPANRHSILLSKITATRLGFKTPAEAIGRNLIVNINPKMTVTVIGVFADYQNKPLLNFGYHQSKGIALTYKDYVGPEESWSLPQKVSFRIPPESFKESLSKIESSYNESFSNPLFHWIFLDDTINDRYQHHILVGNQVAMFSFLAVGIAVLGLFGMMMFKIHDKIKEIGIRKVLGAGLHQIAQILLRTSINQVAIASIIGIPVAYYLTEEYLQTFSERIALQWWHLVLPVVVLIIAMLLSIISVVWKAAKSNPVDALKHN